MKSIHTILTDGEFRNIKRKKDNSGLTWREFLVWKVLRERVKK